MRTLSTPAARATALIPTSRNPEDKSFPKAVRIRLRVCWLFLDMLPSSSLWTYGCRIFVARVAEDHTKLHGKLRRENGLLVALARHVDFAIARHPEMTRAPGVHVKVPGDVPHVAAPAVKTPLLKRVNCVVPFCRMRLRQNSMPVPIQKPRISFRFCPKQTVENYGAGIGAFLFESAADQETRRLGAGADRAHPPRLRKPDP